AEPAGHLDATRLGLHAAKLATLFGLVALDAVEALEKVEMPPGAAELAVGCRLQAGLLLSGDDLADLLVLDTPQFLRRDLAPGAPLARGLLRRRAQEVPDHVRAKRGCRSLHGSSPWVLGWRGSMDGVHVDVPLLSAPPGWRSSELSSASRAALGP